MPTALHPLTPSHATVAAPQPAALTFDEALAQAVREGDKLFVNVGVVYRIEYAADGTYRVYTGETK